jgi:hypothetical protein
MNQQRRDFWLVVAITFVAFVLRLWQLGHFPPGWRDDELINSLVISQQGAGRQSGCLLPDASGHEALYHALNACHAGAVWRQLGGHPAAVGVPGHAGRAADLSAGSHPVWPLGWRSLLPGLAFSFWGLMYGRFGLRHVTMPVLVTAAFYFFWRGF